jgi:hypothetical protein
MGYCHDVIGSSEGLHIAAGHQYQTADIILDYPDE